MNLVSFSIKTKGIRNFARRLWTVFTRFGITEKRTQGALHAIIDALRENITAPTFFIPAVVLGRHPQLIAEIVDCGAEIGIHGYVHNDYRYLSKHEQFEQTKQAISVFHETQTPFQGFRNPYLGWTEETLQVLAILGFTYQSNEAVLHDVIDLNVLTPLLKSGYEKSLALFQAITCSTYALRPHYEGALLHIPTSIPDDEMLFDRLRITDPDDVGRVWSKVMQGVYDLGGLYVLNLHPERAILCIRALRILLSYAHNRTLPVWVVRLWDIAVWWKERSQFRLNFTSLPSNQWRVEASCTPRATLLVRHVSVEDQPTLPWFGNDVRVESDHFTVKATKCPCIGLSERTSEEVVEFLNEQGYPGMRYAKDEADRFALYLDIPEGLGTTRQEQFQCCCALVEQIEQLEEPLVHYGCWPNGSRAALGVSSDIDSVTIQDFFLRVLEVRSHR
jgi:peptidoglycan/xylan/chitin deacetylase (PgdA/CDA1 family)